MTTTLGTNNLKVLFDSDGIIALAKLDDPSHEIAEKILNFLVERESQLLICSTTVVEVLTTLQRRFGDKKIAEYTYDYIIGDRTEIVNVGSELIQEAYGYYRASKSKKNTMIDAVNIAVVKSLNLDAIFSFDEWYTKNKIKLVEKFLMQKS